MSKEAIKSIVPMLPFLFVGVAFLLLAIKYFVRHQTTKYNTPKIPTTVVDVVLGAPGWQEKDALSHDHAAGIAVKTTPDGKAIVARQARRPRAA